MNIILGFPKCGTTSLEVFLKTKFGNYNVTRREWCFMPFEEQMELFEMEFGDPRLHKLYFITRDPKERTDLINVASRALRNHSFFIQKDYFPGLNVFGNLKLKIREGAAF